MKKMNFFTASFIAMVLSGCQSTSNQPPKLNNTTNNQATKSSGPNGCGYDSINSPEFKLTKDLYTSSYFTHSPDGKGYKYSDYYDSLKIEPFKLTGVTEAKVDKYSSYDILHKGKEYLRLEGDIMYKLTLPNEVTQVVTKSCDVYWLKKDNLNFDYITRADGSELNLSDNILIYGENNLTPLVMRPLESEKDKFKKTNTLRGIEYKGRFFRTWASTETNKLLTPSAQLYTTLVFNEWAHVERAYDESGKKYEITKIGTDTSCSQYGCTLYEYVGLDLPISFLEKHKNGFEIQFEGNQKQVVVISGYQVQQLLLGINGYI